MRKVILVEDPSKFDSAILNLLSPSNVSFLQTSDQEQEKATLLNIIAKLKALDLIQYFEEILRTRDERAYFKVSSGLYTELQRRVQLPTLPFYAEGRPKASVHREIFALLNLTEPDTYTQWSYRQEGRSCLQVVITAPSNSNDYFYADCDIDLFNPLQDLEGLVGHLWELEKGVTDAMALLPSLQSQPALVPFLYYKVVNV